MNPLKLALALSLSACGGGTVIGDGSGGGGGGGGGGGETGGDLFPNGSVFYSSVANANLDPNSAAIIAWLDGAGGWGTGEMRVDFGLEILEAKAGDPVRSFEPTDDHFSPDCDVDPIPMPLDGTIENSSSYECVDDGDCHLIVVDREQAKLYEMWRANVVDGTFYGGCLAVWDMSKVYDNDGRGQGCTSADAAGFPIAPLVFNADEVASGDIGHAIRFILPNARIRDNEYVAPATHSTSATSGDSDAPAYGQRLRLRADFPLDQLPSDGARTVAKAMQTYGIMLADGGNIALTAQSDRLTTAKWDGLLDTRDLDSVLVTDFEVVDSGPAKDWSGDCVRN